MFLLEGSSSSLSALLHVDARKKVSCEESRKEDVNFGNERSWDRRPFGVEKIKVRHRELTAHARARYRCFLPDLAGLAGVRRVRPMSDLNHFSIAKLWTMGSSFAIRAAGRDASATAAGGRRFVSRPVIFK